MDSYCFDLQTLRAALGGDIVGDQVLCPGPGHSPRDRSLSVKPTATGFVVYSHCGDDWRECQDHVRERLGLPRWREQRQPASRYIPRTDPQNEPPHNVERAQRLWHEGCDPRGTPAEEYLASRKLDLPAELCGTVLRYHPHCPWRTDDEVVFIPCLLATFTSIADNTVKAVHRIRLDEPQRWPKTERRMLGETRDAAIKLDVAGERLCVAEGVETAMAARQLGFSPVWAAGSARRFLPIPGVNELIVLGEHDEASRKAAAACALFWQDQGRSVSMAMPTIGKDFNDYLLGAQ